MSSGRQGRGLVAYDSQDGRGWCGEAHPRGVFWASVALVVTVLSGCSGSEERTEARGVLHAVDEVIQAQPGQKAEPHARLEATVCTKQKLCQLRDSCVEAFRPMASNELIQAEIRAKLQGIEAPDSAAPAGSALASLEELQKKLHASNEALKISSEQIDQCLRNAADVRRTNHLLDDDALFGGRSMSVSRSRVAVAVLTLVAFCPGVAASTPIDILKGHRYDSFLQEQYRSAEYSKNLVFNDSITGEPEASSSTEDGPALAAIDGDERSAWRGREGEPLWTWTLPFRRPIHLGLLRFRFGDSSIRGVPPAFRWEAQLPVNGTCPPWALWKNIIERDDRHPNQFVHGPMHVHVQRQVAWADIDACGIRLVVPESTANEPEGPPVLREVQVFEGAKSITTSQGVIALDPTFMGKSGPPSSKTIEMGLPSIRTHSEPSNILDGVYETVWIGQEKQSTWELSILLPDVKWVDRVYLALGLDGLTVPRNGQAGRDYSVSLFPKKIAIETSGSDSGDDFLPVEDEPLSSEPNDDPPLRRRLIQFSIPRPVRRLRLTMTEATNLEGVVAPNGVPMVRDIKLFESSDKSPVLVPPVFFSVNSNPSPLTHATKMGEAHYDGLYSRDFYHRLRRIVAGVDVDTHWTADVSVKRTLGTGKFIEAIEGDDPALGRELIRGLYPRPVLVLSGALDWEFDSASHPWPGLKTHYRWNVSALATHPDRGMGRLINAVQNRITPMIGFCGGAQIMALFESQGYPNNLPNDFDVVLLRNANIYIRGRVDYPEPYEKAWWTDQPFADPYRPVFRFDPSDRLFDTLAAEGATRESTKEIPSSHGDMIRESAFNGPLSRLKPTGWSTLCRPWVREDGPERTWIEDGMRCVRVPQAYYSKDGEYPIIGFQFHPEQRDFQRLAPESPEDARGDAMNVVGNAIWMITDAYLGRRLASKNHCNAAIAACALTTRSSDLIRSK